MSDIDNVIKEKTLTLKKWINECGSFVFFGGAGVSTESGIPDFRSAEGLYNEESKVPPEKMVSHTFFKMHPKEFFDFYKNKMVYTDAKPSVTHMTLARLEKEGKCKAVITQNIDGLHQMAGSKNVLELHGSIYRNYCIKCGRPYELEAILTGKGARLGQGRFEGVPVCECGGVIKPDVVLYEESLDASVINESVELISKTPLLIIGGTSLNVYPAAGLLNHFRGKYVAIINKEPTPFDEKADLLIQGALGDVFSFF